MVQGLACKFYWNRKGLVTISKNTWAYSKKCKGSVIIEFMWWGLFEKIVKERVLFEIKSRGGGALYGIEERGRGFWQSRHSLPPPSTGNRGMGERRRRRPIRPLWATATAGVRGKRE